MITGETSLIVISALNLVHSNQELFLYFLNSIYMTPWAGLVMTPRNIILGTLLDGLLDFHHAKALNPTPPDKKIRKDNISSNFIGWSPDDSQSQNNL